MSLKFLGNKNLKNLKKENLIGNMTNIELVLNMLAEVTTTVISPLNATDKPSPELHEKSEETDENEGGNSPETD